MRPKGRQRTNRIAVKARKGAAQRERLKKLSVCADFLLYFCLNIIDKFF